MATAAKTTPTNTLIYGFAPYQAKTGEEYMCAAQIAHFFGHIKRVEKRADGRS